MPSDPPSSHNSHLGGLLTRLVNGQEALSELVSNFITEEIGSLDAPAPALKPLVSPPYPAPRLPLDSSASLFRPVSFLDVKIDSPFWKGWMETIALETLPAIHGQLKSTRRLEYLTGNWKEGMDWKPNKYDESDVTKFIEAASYALQHNPSNASELRSWIEEAIELLLSFQQEDGYINAYILTVSEMGPFENLRDLHELYNLGHALEALVAYSLLPSPNPAFLAGILRYLSLVERKLSVSADGPCRGGYPGHQEFELALIRFVESGLVEEEAEKTRWLSLASNFIEERGKGGEVKLDTSSLAGADEGDDWVEVGSEDLEGGNEVVDASKKKLTRKEGEMYYDWELRRAGGDPFNDKSWWNKSWHDSYDYMQAHLPIRSQDAVLGHSVRVVYWLTAATDLARLLKDRSLLTAVETLWDDMESKTYISGGIGSNPSTEGFSETPYDLPNHPGAIYAETCAAIGKVFLAHRLLQVDINSAYSDALEWTLFNAVLCGISSSGKAFFYDNPLEVFNNKETKRAEWFTCSCCPPNVSRLLSSLGNYIYSTSPATATTPFEVAIHLFVASRTQIDFGDGKLPATMIVETEYPLEGTIKISFEGLEGRKVGLRIRAPGWLGNESFTLTQIGLPLVASTITKGYLSLPPSHFTSSSSSPIIYTLPLTPKPITPHPLVSQNQSKVAFHRGPILYAFESIDHLSIPDLRLLSIPKGGISSWERYDVDASLLGRRAGGNGLRWGLKGMAKQVLLEKGSEGELEEVEVKLVPYAMWGNRGVGDLVVWVGAE